jgi:D-glycero-D-manno-heptose 1,7-bisphosphate phosphatase
MNASDQRFAEINLPSDKRPAIFIDRDGVIIHNQPAYVRSLNQVKIYPRAIQAIALAAASDYRIVIVTNQAGIGKGLYSFNTVNEIHQVIMRAVEQAGGRIDGIYVCPHKTEDECDCRKPKPGLLTRAAHELKLDLASSYMVGDAISDIQAGQQAGVKQAILVLTGRGLAQKKLALAGHAVAPFIVRKSLYEAIKSIMRLPQESDRTDSRQ